MGSLNFAFNVADFKKVATHALWVFLAAGLTAVIGVAKGYVGVHDFGMYAPFIASLISIATYAVNRYVVDNSVPAPQTAAAPQ